MIGDTLFFIKMIIMTSFFILFLQIKIGDNTLEQKVKVAITQSAAVEPLQEVAKGGVKAIEQGWQFITKTVGHRVKSTFSNDNMPGNRSITLDFGRSKKYLKEKYESAKQSEAVKTIQAKQQALKEDLAEELKDEGFYIDEE